MHRALFVKDLAGPALGSRGSRPPLPRGRALVATCCGGSTRCRDPVALHGPGSTRIPGQLCPADPADVPRSRRGGVAGADRGGARRRAPDWAETAARCRRFASALRRRGIGPGRPWRFSPPTRPALFEAHFGVPMAGAVLNALNYRLDAALDRLHPRPWRGQAADRRPRVRGGRRSRRSRCSAGDPGRSTSTIRARQAARLLGEIEYEEFLAEGDPELAWSPPADEWEAIALNYTSGTTGNPKGVVYHHRGAYLNALGNALVLGLRPASGLSLDPADVPLQRLVLSLDGDGGRRHACLPARGSSRRRSSPRSPSIGSRISAARRSC